MKIAVISDIHANMDALKQVLKDIQTLKIDNVISLGDNIGYGPEPNEVITALSDMMIPSVMGNHEKAVINPKFIKWFNPTARIAIRKTLELLSTQSIEYINNTNDYIIQYGCRFVHGFPPDFVNIYQFMVTHKKMIKAFMSMNEKLCFIGHTHDLEIIEFDGFSYVRKPLLKGRTQLEDDKKYIINIGSVGQPRDGNKQAKYLIYDQKEHNIEIRYISYDAHSTVKKIKQVGMPMQYANRLL